MLTIESVVGNIFENKKLMTRFKQMDTQEKSERLKISRLELERGRVRRKTDRGTDVGLVLGYDQKLHHGDVIVRNRKKFIIIEQLPEKVLYVKLRELKGDIIDLVMLGHIIGNRHKPIMINDDVISFPVQSDSEVDAFRKLLSGFTNNLEIEVKEQIFQPQTGLYMHEH